ncbi:MAG: aminotransferase class V-fold PLP-dependent enzyme, partial [Acidobacteria bacterium]|nr:aminotransferase class V-fold PLP-dependent enzyme [Acidobacteriota bacterium]
RAAISRSLDHMQMAGRIALTRVDAGDDGRIDPATLVRAVAHRTRLVILSHGCEVLGTVQPVEEVARMLSGHKALLLVDASHTAGLVPLQMDSWGIDLVATSGHRGLYGPPGVGLLLVGSDVRLRPLREGESGGDPSLSTQPLDLPWSLEAGVPNMPGIVGLLAGMRFVSQQTPATLREHDTTLIKRFIGAVGLDERFHLYAARGDMPRTGTVSFTLRGFAPLQVAQVLEKVHDIQVAAGLHAGSRVHAMLKTAPAGTVRVSVGWFNNEDEIDRTVAALREMADAGVKQALGHVGA